MIRYSIFHNASARFMRGAQAGDTLIEGWQSTLDVAPDVNAREAVYRQHNRDSRPDGRQAPSMSVGDVVVIDGVGTFTVENLGWSEFDLSTAKVVDGPWIDVIDAAQAGLL